MVYITPKVRTEGRCKAVPPSQELFRQVKNSATQSCSLGSSSGQLGSWDLDHNRGLEAWASGYQSFGLEENTARWPQPAVPPRRTKQQTMSSYGSLCFRKGGHFTGTGAGPKLVGTTQTTQKEQCLFSPSLPATLEKKIQRQPGVEKCCSCKKG